MLTTAHDPKDISYADHQSHDPKGISETDHQVHEPKDITYADCHMVFQVGLKDHATSLSDQ